MLHFSKSIFLFSMLGLTVVAFAQSVKIDPQRVEVSIKQYLQQSDNELSADEINGYRKIITERLQKAEILKNEALALGLDKKPEIQLLLKNNLAMFYADHYEDYLNQNIVVDEASLKQFYTRFQRGIKIQLASFTTQKDAIDAQNKLKKGMSFRSLLNSLENQPPFSDDFITVDELPDAIAIIAINMEKGQISSQPIRIEYQDSYYLIKIVDVSIPSDIAVFEELDPKIKAKMIEIKKYWQVMDKLHALYEKHGLSQ